MSACCGVRETDLVSTALLGQFFEKDGFVYKPYLINSQAFFRQWPSISQAVIFFAASWMACPLRSI